MAKKGEGKEKKTIKQINDLFRGCGEVLLSCSKSNYFLVFWPKTILGQKRQKKCLPLPLFEKGSYRVLEDLGEFEILKGRMKRKREEEEEGSGKKKPCSSSSEGGPCRFCALSRPVFELDYVKVAAKGAPAWYEERNEQEKKSLKLSIDFHEHKRMVISIFDKHKQSKEIRQIILPLSRFETATKDLTINVSLSEPSRDLETQDPHEEETEGEETEGEASESDEEEEEEEEEENEEEEEEDEEEEAEEEEEEEEDDDICFYSGTPDRIEFITVENRKKKEREEGEREREVNSRKDFTGCLLHYKAVSLRLCSTAERARMWKAMEEHPLTAAAINVSVEFKYEMMNLPPLGVGSFASVLPVKRKSDSKEFALKVISKTKIPLRFLELQRREWRLLHSFKHPNIVRVFEYFETNHQISFVLEKCTGGDLQTVLEEWVCERELSPSLPLSTTQAVLSQLISALEYLHLRGVVHRDVKMENLLFLRPYHPSQKGNVEVLLGDFGTARSNFQKCSTFIGTKYYVAPEVIDVRRLPTKSRRHQQFYTSACDMWSCGVVLYALLSGGDLPFDSKDDNDAEIFKNIQKKRYSTRGQVWKGCDRDAKKLLARFLSKDPEKRITATVAKFHNFLQKKIEDERDYEEYER